MTEQSKSKKYLTAAAAGAVGVGLGAAGYATTLDKPVQDTTEYQNLQEKLTEAQNNADDFEKQVADLQTTVTDKEERVSNLESQVKQFNATVEELRAENADLEDAVAQGDERVGIVDYFPVFTENTDVEYDSFDVVSVDHPYDNGDGEGDFTRIDVTTEDPDEGHQYDVKIVEFEESEDADDWEDDQRDFAHEVSFSVSGDEHTVGVSAQDASTGSLDDIKVEYEDDDVLQDVSDEEDIETVTVDGEDVTEDVDTVSVSNNGEELTVTFESGNYVNEGDEISLTFSEADGDDAPEIVTLNGHEYEYDQDYEQFVYRNDNTVVVGEGIEASSGDEDDYDAQYDEFVTQYE